MFGPLTHDGMMRLARRERASPRRESPIRAELGTSPEAVEHENALVDDVVEHDDAFGGPDRRKQTLFTLGRALQMSTSAPTVAHKCCAKRCLHAMEIQQPGWIAQQRGKLRKLVPKRKASRRVRLALSVVNGNGPRGRCRQEKNGGRGVPHCAAYVQAFMEIDKALSEKNACASSRLHFVSANFLYGRPLEEARAAAALGTPSASSNTNSRSSRSSLQVMTESDFCCSRNCLGGNLIAGVDAMQYWIERAANARTQRAKQVMIREFHCQFPGVCRNAAQAVLRVSRDSITKARKTPSAPPPHGLIAYYEAHPRPLNFVQDRLVDFFATFIAGCPTSRSGLAHINSAVPVNGKKGFWKLFRRMNPQLQCKESMFMANLSRYLRNKRFRGLDKARVDHNVCPVCATYKYEKDALILQRAMLRENGERLRDSGSAIEGRLQELADKEKRLEEAHSEHEARNVVCREHVAWWQHQAKFANAATKECDGLRSATRASVPRIAMWHCDGETSRKLPQARLASDGGGFLGRMQKNVGFADLVTGECENYFLPDLLHTESVSMLVDLLLQRAMRCRGEQVLVLVTDCCVSNYNGTLWAAIVWMVDELRWFEAVVVLYYMPRHGKGDADKFFGGHKKTWQAADVLSADQLAQYYVDASDGKENVVHVMPHAVCDWKSWLEAKYRSRTANQLGVQALGFNQVVAVRSSIEQTALAQEVKERLRPFIANPGWYRARRGNEVLHEYMVFPTAPKPGFVPGKPPPLLPEVEFDVDEAGDVGDPKYPINRTNAVANGFNNANFSTYANERAITAQYFGSDVVPVDFRPENMRAHGGNFINRRTALRENLPSTGPLHPSPMDLNLLLNRRLYTTEGLEFVSHVADGNIFLAACADDESANYAELVKFSEEVEREPSRFVTTADVVEATTPGYTFTSATPSMSIADYMLCRRKFGNIAAFKRPPPPSQNVFDGLGGRMLALARR